MFSPLYEEESEAQRVEELAQGHTGGRVAVAASAKE